MPTDVMFAARSMTPKENLMRKEGNGAPGRRHADVAGEDAGREGSES
ncbi:MAG: hypothetical protein M3N18_04365 [Actinomycetota bacterium]|nr:hypothetical protein [Actinomycetota bacterium]